MRASRDWTDDFGRLSFSVVWELGGLLAFCAINGFRAETAEASDVGEVDINLLFGMRSFFSKT